MQNSVRDEILVYLANKSNTMISAKKDFRRVEASALPKLEVDFRYGKQFFNGNAICGEEFLMFKHEGRLLRLKDCCDAQLKKNDHHISVCRDNRSRRKWRVAIVFIYLAVLFGLTWFIYGKLYGFSLTEGFQIGKFIMILIGLIVASFIALLVIPLFSFPPVNPSAGEAGVFALGGLLMFFLGLEEDGDYTDQYIPTMFLRMRFVPGSRTPERVKNNTVMVPLYLEIPEDAEREEFNRYLAEQISRQTARRQTEQHGT